MSQLDEKNEKKSTNTGLNTDRKNTSDTEEDDIKKGDKSDKLKKDMSNSKNVSNEVTIEKCIEAFLAKKGKIEKEYDERAKRSGWTNKDGSLKDDGSRARFLQTMPSYCKKAINEHRIVVDKSKPEYVENPALAFYDQYIDEKYVYTEEKKAEVKQKYTTKGASAIINGWDVLNAFGMYKQIGRDEGNFVTSLEEDVTLFKDQGVDLEKLHNNADAASKDSDITEEKAEKVALAKGLPTDKFNTGMYQYIYSPEFINNANNIKKANGENALFTANGDMKGANPLNLPGMMTWVESKAHTVAGADTADAQNIQNSESELMVPTIKLDDSQCFKFSENLFSDDKELDNMKELLENGRPSLITTTCFVKDKDGKEVFKGEIKGNVKVRVLQPAQMKTRGDWTKYQIDEKKKKDAENAAKAADPASATTSATK